LFKTRKNKTTISAGFSLLIITVTLLATPLASAHTPTWSIQPYLYIHVAPNPVGISQQVSIVMFTTWALQGADYYNDIRFHNFKLTINKPDGTQEVKSYPVVTDSRGWIFLDYTPKQIGTYTLSLDYPGQTYTWNQANTQVVSSSGFYNYENDTILPANATTTFTVQQEQVRKLTDTPLPTEYWTRPINAQNNQWRIISSNWLGGAATSDHWQQEGSAPKTPHIMWTKPLELGGIVGGSVNPDDIYYVGFGFETPRFKNPIIISGILIYELSLSNSGAGGGTIAVNIQTGEEIWYLPNVAISKAQIFNFEQTPNQHGAVAPILWEESGNTWHAYDALTGNAIFNLTNVPSGKEAYALSNQPYENSGMIVRYELNYNTTTRQGWLALWNNTLAVLNQQLVSNSPGWRPAGKGNIDAANAYSWNVTISSDLVGSKDPAIVSVIPNDIVLGRSSDLALSANWHPMSDPWTMWTLNLNQSKGPIGSLLWIKNYPTPSGNQTIMFAEQPIDPVNRVFILTDHETGQRMGYNLDNGELIWQTNAEQRAIQYFSNREGFPAYGIFYVAGFGGEIMAYSTKYGQLLWKYTNKESDLNTPWGLYPIHLAAAADGIIYGFPGDYAEANIPLYKGETIHAINATTGEEIWSLMGWSASGLTTTIEPIAIADGFMVYRNIYDSQIYCIGKGPSATTVTASPEVLVEGNNVLIKGTVLDIAQGTKQLEQIARFPNGIPAVSDSSMTDWMAYIYMQQPRPQNATGVDVVLSVLDSNGNFREIGKATSNSEGFFALKWIPDIPGTYILYASFAGSEGYWPSQAVTAFTVDPATPPAASSISVQSFSDMYFVPAVAIIVATIAIGFAITILVLRKRQ
jgi:hypothetical protein